MKGTEKGAVEEIRGQIERVTFYNEESGYSVLRCKVPGRVDLVTVVGNIPNPVPGELLRIQGSWKQHPRYGEQFQSVFFTRLAPATLQGIRRYLGSGLVKGIGPVMADRIVERFGEKTLEVIERDPHRLLEVEGIGEKRVEQIGKAWEEQKEIRTVMLFLQSQGVSATYATKIYKQYGNDSVRVVRENPYRLASDVTGIGFLTADKIAFKLGFSKDSPLRAEAGILYVLNRLAEEGHVFFPKGPLIERCRQMLDIDEEQTEAAIDRVSGRGGIVIDEEAVYLAAFYQAEVGSARLLKRLLSSPKSLPELDPEMAIPALQKSLSFQLAERQVKALKMACSEKVMILTGGPGTGKTTIIRALLRLFSGLGVRALLAAPTGRAAKRMSEATGRQAKTLHRLLEYSSSRGGFQRNEENPLPCDLLIVDETSMVDIVLFYHLLKAVPPSATLVLVGDTHQLPSVGAGNVLGDLIASGAIPVIELNEIFRQARKSHIIVNAHRINEGKMPASNGDLNGGLRDFYFIEEEDPEKVLSLILKLVLERIPSRFGFDPVDDIQVLSPMHRGIVGAENLNAELQKRLNPKGEEILRGSRAFRAGDKVMQIRNDYDREVFNGDIGRIVGIDKTEQEVRVRIDGREVVYDFGDLDELVHAYAVSVHKSQGSEYPAVVLPLLTQHYLLLQRNLLYTAVTRGRKLVVLVGTKKALAIAVRNDKMQKRFTRLAERVERFREKETPSVST